MWEIDIADQVLTFFLSMLLGAVLCLVYDIMRAVRKFWLNKYWSVFITDIIYWIFSALITFIFLISRTNGEIRGYVFIGELLGFILCRITISRVFFYVMYCFLKKINTLKSRLNKAMTLFYIKFERSMLCICNNIIRFLKSIGKTIKKLLKKGNNLLYTNNNNVNVENIVDETKTET